MQRLYVPLPSAIWYDTYRRIGADVLGQAAVEVGREPDVEEAVFLTLEDVDAVREFLHRYRVTLAR